MFLRKMMDCRVKLGNDQLDHQKTSGANAD